MQHFKFLNWCIGEFVVSFFDVTNRLVPWTNKKFYSVSSAPTEKNSWKKFVKQIGEIIWWIRYKVAIPAVSTLPGIPTLPALPTALSREAAPMHMVQTQTAKKPKLDTGKVNNQVQKDVQFNENGAFSRVFLIQRNLHFWILCKKAVLIIPPHGFPTDEFPIPNFSDCTKDYFDSRKAATKADFISNS